MSSSRTGGGGSGDRRNTTGDDDHLSSIGDKYNAVNPFSGRTQSSDEHTDCDDDNDDDNNGGDDDSERQHFRVAAAGDAEEDNGADCVRPGSPFLHRRDRRCKPSIDTAPAPDAPLHQAAGGVLSVDKNLPGVQESSSLLSSSLRPCQRLLPTVSCDSIRLSIASSNSSGDERRIQGREAMQTRAGNDDDSDNDGNTKGGRTESVADSMGSSPPVVTLWSVASDLRRKRIKKVSHYILGPLLGEGSYGVVRDCINLNTDNADRRFSRCAIKIISGSYATCGTQTITPSQARWRRRSATAENDKAQGSNGAVSTLKRTSGAQYRRDEDLRRQETLQRELRNLQRFHSKNIIRALDTFTRYSKEYVVMPIAICSMQQLVEELLRTRWHEAVREWRRSHRCQGKDKRGTVVPSASSQQAQPPPEELSWISIVTSAMGEVDMDNSSCMLESDGNDVDCGDDSDKGAHEGGSKTRQLHPCGAITAKEGQADRTGQSRRPHRFDSADFSNPTRVTHRDVRSRDFSYECHPSDLPQVRLGGSSFPAFAGGHHRSDSDSGSGADDTSDSSSGSTTGTLSSIAVMSATPPALCAAAPPLKYNDLIGKGTNGAGPDGSENEPAAIALPSPAGFSRYKRPRVSLPLCSPTLLKGILYQLISGVAYLHRQHLAHNDIKPSNVLFFEDGTVKLADLGSVSDTYNDQGSALCASPELCKYFYGAATPPPSFSQSTQDVGKDAAQPSDMWCCGLILYYLITGMPGPLPVHMRYSRSLRSKQTTQQFRLFSRDGHTRQSALPPIITRYQLYREIAHQKMPVDLSGLPDIVPPDMGDDALHPTTMATPNTGEAPKGDSGDNSGAMPTYPHNSVRNLLAGLLELDPLRRLTAEQALHHPWLRMAFRSKTNVVSKNTANNTNGKPHEDAQRPSKMPSQQAMEEAIQRDVARRVMESRHVQHMLRLDQQRHLQFVADCCNMLKVDIPPEIIKAHTREPYRRDSGAAAAAALSERSSRLGDRPTHTGSPRPHDRAGNNEWSVTSCNSSNAIPARMFLRDNTRPSVMPPGCVDTELFLPLSEEDYYEQKSGKKEFDVRVLRRKPLVVAQLKDYLHNVVLVQCGYRTGPDPDCQAMVSLRAATENNSSGRRYYSGGTQQPAVIITSGASGGIDRCGQPNRLLPMPTAVAAAAVRHDRFDTAAANNNGESADVCNSGPHHQPRTRMDGGYRVIVADSSTGVTAGGGATTSRTTTVTGRALTTDASLFGAVVQSGSSAPGDTANGSGSRRRRRMASGSREQENHNTSETPSEEVKVAMRESSKCLCGLV
ncbi:hypothetical protein JKF63_07721 [Porcisia hertigi]|uniref:Protein kinase domain-containing protein n=1 Tax=Porcisia hertigi TaxID=2761500 RepID=A0A836LLW5_9TRYP|nr:hypothetical protein JKF63_07721 [Porcisia hertigi]